MPRCSGGGLYLASNSIGYRGVEEVPNHVGPLRNATNVHKFVKCLKLKTTDRAFNLSSEWIYDVQMALFVVMCAS